MDEIQLASLEKRIARLAAELASAAPPASFESDDPRMAQVYDVLFHTARSSASLLILGERGTGKSLAALAVHDRSHLADGPFVTLSCRNLAPAQIESELFGGADTAGKIAAAHGGTLFLDEIGDLPKHLQPRLLRLLQDGEYEPAGENTSRPANVRLIAAASRDLSAAVAAGAFREDLFYRLNVVSVTIPPLRQRPVDVLRLAEHFLAFFGRQIGVRVESFDPAARDRLLAHSWPGNVRELRNFVERAVILGRTPLSDVDPFEVLGESSAPPSAVRVGAPVRIEALERLHIERVLEFTETQEAAARILGIDPATLYRKRKKWERESPL